jgi:malonyl-CoA/methylmalonyl-CoA synthetase
VDIIKSGGFKISALDIEREILEHPAVEEAVVLGVEDDIKGEAICVLLRLGGGHGTEGAAFGEGGLRGWMKTFTAGYKLPSKVQVLDEIPKNAMGKYAKKELKKLFL